MEQVSFLKISDSNTRDGIQELTDDEALCVSGGGKAAAAAAAGLAGAIGTATFGSTWGAVGVGVAFAAAPVAVVAMTGLVGCAAYLWLKGA
jgi:hypothetical protein